MSRNQQYECVADRLASALSPWIRLFTLIAASCLLQSTIAFADESQATLTWNNEDSLGGELVGYQDKYIQWRSTQFKEPLEVHSDYIAAIDFPKPKQKPDSSSELFRVESVGGNVFFGNLKSIDEKFVAIESQRLGSIRLKREHTREIRHLKHTKVVFDGPRWLDGWRTLRAGRLVSEWEATENGHLRTTKYNGELFRDLPKLEHAEIVLVLRWTGKPGLQIDFSSPAELVAPGGKTQLSIKSWGSDLVATSSMGGSDFQHLLKLTEHQTELRLRVIWDNKVGEAIVSDPSGKIHGRVLVDKSKKKFGILVKNRSDNLTVERIRLSKWNGISKSEIREDGKSYVRLADGKLLTDTIESLTEGKITLSKGDTVDLEELAMAELKPSGKATPHDQHLRFQDGTELLGQIKSIDREQIKIDIPAVESLVTAKRNGIHSLHCFQGRTDQFEFHLDGNGNRLSGNLAPVPKTEALGWAPIGSKSSLPLTLDSNSTIERRMARTSNARPLDTEIIFLRDDSVMFGEVHEINEKELTLTTAYTKRQTIPVTEVRAIEMLSGSGRISFADAGWEFMRESRPLQQAAGRIEISDPISMRNSKLDHGGRVSFSCTWGENFSGLLSVHMGANDRQPRNSLVRFTFSQNRVSARSLMNAATSQTLPIFSERRANISIDTADKTVTVWVNGIKVFQTATKQQVSTKGLWLQGGSAKSLVRGGAESSKPRLVIDRLRMGDGAGKTGAGFATNESLEMILKLPRNRISDAPECVLCAANGDLLRGKLIRADDQLVSFKSRYEEVSLPREDVSALVWLRPAEEKPNEIHADSLLLTIRDGSKIRINRPKILGNALVGEHPLLSTCTIPLEMVLRIQGSTAESSGNTFAWSLKKTPEPKFVEDGAGDGLDSLLIGQNVSEVKIPMFDDTELRIGDEDRILVLDFWASWCAPCIRSLPKFANMAKQFPEDKVRFLAVNEQENEFAIQGFLSSRGLELEVAMDEDGSLAQKFDVKAIPQTIIIGPTGKVERHFVGAPADLHEKVSQEITNLLPSSD